TNGGDQAGSNAEPAEHGARDLTHFLLYGNGFRTWEYAPEFNIRSWSYAGLHAVLGLVAIPFVGFDNKVAHTVSLHYRKAIYHKSRQIGVFYAIRAILAIMCAFVEYQLVVATRKWYGRQIANWLLLYLIFAPGMTAASTAYLTSSFSMYFTTLAFSCWLNPTASIKRIATVVGLTYKIISFLKDESFSNDLRYWSLLVVHQLSLLESLHAILILKQMIPILGLMTRSTFGNSNMQKYCLHSLVRLISSLGTDAQKKLSELIDLNIVSIIGGCLKNDDGELVSWAVFFIQEFVTRDIARVEFAKIRGIAKILVDTIDHPISGAESFMPRVTLRTLKCLAVRNNEFQQEILKFGVLKKIIPFLESGDTEAQFWAISL
ncbi:hypothetical protein HDU82_001456, partial [Entophlyctis luteolus]